MSEAYKTIIKSVDVLSCFDGMACGMLAMQGAGVKVNNYYAYEIDKYAIKTVQHNFPQIKELGDVFEADFTQYKGIDFLVGGSPCTFWSIAQSPDKRETTASGLGWELFSQYVRALHEAQPKYFIYENNKSMARDIYNSISETFGFEPIMINSALVSAQNRQRYYWVGRRNSDGTYSKVDVKQPKDRGILLKDILNIEQFKELSENEMNYMTRSHADRRWNHCQKPNEKDKSECLVANVSKGVPYNVVAQQLYPVGTTKDGKAFAVTAYYSTGQNAPHTLTKHIGSMVAEKVDSAIQVGALPRPNGELSTSQGFRIYSTNGKSVTLKAGGGGAGGKTGLYAIPIEFVNESPVKAVSCTDGKEYTVYSVSNGMITIKNKSYPIKLCDGYYIIRKLTVEECKRLQTVPEWYEFPVSDTQSYKMLGNSWTVEVIIHLIKAILEE